MEIRQPVSVNRDYTYFFVVSQMFAFKLNQLPMGVEVLASIFWKALDRILKCIFSYRVD